MSDIDFTLAKRLGVNKTLCIETLSFVPGGKYNPFGFA